MARGFLSGAIWGTVLSIGGLGAASVLLPERPDMTPRAIPDQIAEAPQLDEEDLAAVEPDAVEPGSAVEPDGAVEAEMEADAPETETDLDLTPNEPESETQDAAPREAPPVVMETETQTAETADPSTTDAPKTVPARRPSEETAVAPDADAPALEAPDDAQDTAPADTEAAPVPSPDTGDEIAALDAPSDGDAPAAPSGTTSEAAPGSAPAPDLTAPESEPRLNVVTEPAQPPAPAVPEVDSALAPDAPETEMQPEPETDTEAQTATMQDAPAIEDTPEPADRPQVRRLVPDVPESDAAPEGDETAALARPRIGTPATSLTDRNQGTSTGLPSIGGDETDEEAPADTAPDPTDARPPLERFAAEVQSDPSLPQMSIVLIDDGTGPLGPDTLDGFPFPVTFALDPGRAEAAGLMAAYRAAGYEVAALVDLPEAAQPSDVEQILAGAVAAVPEAVALIEAPGGGLQSGRDTAEQATSFALESGHGLVFLPNGLNTAQAIAERENVPSASILRDFDGDGQDARTKRRFLDGAAFRARQDGQVIMLGRLTPDTLSALLLWSLQDRAASVSMVPVSTILRDTSE
jgi:polysaccharide deacetylase 2 family uncharacterized protein YibQ